MKTILLITVALILTACGKHDPTESGCDEPYYTQDCVKSCSLFMRDNHEHDHRVWRYYFASRDLCTMNGAYVSKVDRGFYVDLGLDNEEHTQEQ